MNKSLKLMIFVITLCLVGMFTACSNINSGNNTVLNDKNHNNDNESTVDGLPVIKLTEDMSLDDIEKIFVDVNNYKYHLESILETIGDGGSVEIDVICTEKGKLVITKGSETDLLKYQVFLNEDNRYYYLTRDSSMNEYYYYVSTKPINFDELGLQVKLAYTYLTQPPFDEISSYKVENEQLFFEYQILPIRGTGCLYDINKNTLNIEKYFPGYKSLDIGTNLPDSTLYNSQITQVQIHSIL